MSGSIWESQGASGRALDSSIERLGALFLTQETDPLPREEDHPLAQRKNINDSNTTCPEEVIEGLPNSRKRVSDRPVWILISKTSPGKRPLLLFLFR